MAISNICIHIYTFAFTLTAALSAVLIVVTTDDAHRFSACACVMRLIDATLVVNVNRQVIEWIHLSSHGLWSRGSIDFSYSNFINLIYFYTIFYLGTILRSLKIISFPIFLLFAQLMNNGNNKTIMMFGVHNCKLLLKKNSNATIYEYVQGKCSIGSSSLRIITSMANNWWECICNINTLNGALEIIAEPEKIILKKLFWPLVNKSVLNIYII